MFTADDLDDDLSVGIEPDDAADAKPSEDAPAVEPARLVPDSPVAQSLWRVWGGEPVTVVDSPPGGGKSTLVATVIAHLVVRGGLRVTLATPTKRAAYAIAQRLAEQIPHDQLNFQVTGYAAPPEVFNGRRNYFHGGHVTVRTLASAKRSAPECDLLVVDEAYQCTFAEVAAAANKAGQILMVGDPGQIGPVVTVDTSAWDHMKNAPHRRAPEVFIGRPDTEVVHIKTSYRLGADTVEAIAPLYDFPFVSGRVGRTLTGADGRRRAELECVQVDSRGAADNVDALTEVADLAASMVGSVRADVLDSGVETTGLTDTDVAVVVSHNSQANIVSGLLGGLDHGDIAVGTADRMQGGQWSAVVAVDPAFGYTEPSSHMMSMGRLCVMASRHTASLTWVHDGNWRALFETGGVPGRVASLAVSVREHLTANDVTRGRRSRRRVKVA